MGIKKIKKFFNGYINFCTFLVIMTGVACATLSKNLNLFTDWVLILVFFCRMVSSEKTIDTQHELLEQYRGTIKLLDDEINRLKSKEGE